MRGTEMRLRLNHYPVDHEYRIAFAVRIGTRTLALTLLRNKR